MERRVELLADSGISEKIEQAEWQDIVNNVITGIKNGNFTDHLAKSIQDCGNILAEHFPIKEDDTNELSNEIEELEKWKK